MAEADFLRARLDPACELRGGRLECESPGRLEAAGQAIWNTWNDIVSNTPLVGWVWDALIGWASDAGRKTRLQRLAQAWAAARAEACDTSGDLFNRTFLAWLRAVGYGPLVDLVTEPEWLYSRSPIAEDARHFLGVAVHPPTGGWEIPHRDGALILYRPREDGRAGWFWDVYLGNKRWSADNDRGHEFVYDHASDKYRRWWARSSAAAWLVGFALSNGETDQAGNAYQRSVLGDVSSVELPAQIQADIRRLCTSHANQREEALCMQCIGGNLRAAAVMRAASGPPGGRAALEAVERLYSHELADLRARGLMVDGGISAAAGGLLAAARRGQSLAGLINRVNVSPKPRKAPGGGVLLAGGVAAAAAAALFMRRR